MSKHTFCAAGWKMAVACMAVLLVADRSVSQTILSPTQSDLLTLQYADFVDNMDPGDVFDTASIGSVVADGDDAKITFTTGYDINDDLYRVALEVPAESWSGDLTGLDAFSISFRNPVLAPAGTSATSIGAQIFVRHGGNIFGSGDLFTGSSFSAVSNTGLTTISIPASSIAAAQMNEFGTVDLSDINSFGIELFGSNAFDEFNPDLVDAMVSVTTSPQPPTLADHVLYSWENGDDLEGWDSTPIHPGTHSHVVREGTEGSPAVGATEGLNALQITRHPTTNFFEWGTSKSLQPFDNAAPATGDYNNDATVNIADYAVWRNNLGSTTLPNRDPNNAGIIDQDDYAAWKANFGATGGGADPEIQAELDQIVSLINDPNAYSIAFDLTVESQAPNPDPQYMIVDLGISTNVGPDNGGDVFFQASSGVSLANLGTTQTIEFTLPEIVTGAGLSLADSGLWEETSYLNFHLASNMNLLSADIVFTIDNLRIRTIVPDEAAAISTSIPEPASILTAVLAVCGLGGILRRFQ